MFAKTSVDGHWRGPFIVMRALRDAGFDVIMLGMARADEIVAATIQESADLVGLNVGGRVEIVDHVLDALRAEAPDVPVVAGGTIPPDAVAHLAERGVTCFPPGSSLNAIVQTARTLTGLE